MHDFIMIFRKTTFTKNVQSVQKHNAYFYMYINYIQGDPK